MHRILIAAFVLIAVCSAARDAGAEPPSPNVLLLCVDDLRPELGAFGKDYIHSPNIDALARAGRAFHRHYVQAPTCGASRYTLLTGRYGPSGNGALFERARRMQQEPDSVPPSMPAWFRQHGYTTVSVGKVSHHPGGRGGSDWDDDNQPEMPDSWDRHLLPAGPWQHPRGAMHGLANGEIRGNAGKMDVYQSTPGPDSIYPDGLITDESLRQLDDLAGGDRPFFLAVGLIRPHLPFGAPAKYYEHYRVAKLPPIPHPEKPAGRTTWHSSGEFMKYNRWGRNPNEDEEFATLVRKHYAACVSYADAQVGKILQRLDQLGLRDDTIVVLWGDHGWHLGEHAIWGKHALFEESLRSPLIIGYRGIPQPGAPAHGIVETLDIFPTLCDLAGLPQPDFAQGVSLRPLLESPDAPGHTAVSYARARTIRTDTHRLILHPDGYAELYDHTSPAGETQNVADQQPQRVQDLTRQLNNRLTQFTSVERVLSQEEARAELERLGARITRDRAENVTMIRLSSEAITDDSLINLRPFETLREVWLYRTRVSAAGIESLKMLPALRSLALLGTDITDEKIAAVGKIGQLEWLYCGSSGRPGLTDAGLANLRSLDKLKVLKINGRFTEEGLANLTFLPNLESLDVRNISDDGLRSIAKIEKLRALTLIFNYQLTNAGLEHLAELDQLVELDLGGTKATGSGIVHLKTLANLQVLKLGACSVHDDDLRALSGFRNLTELGLDGNPITDAGLETLAELKHLRTLEVRHTKTTPAGLQRLKLQLPRTKITSGGTYRGKD